MRNASFTGIRLQRAYWRLAILACMQWTGHAPGQIYSRLNFGHKKGLRFHVTLSLYGAGTRNRTRDLLITSQLLYQLSYTGL